MSVFLIFILLFFVLSCKNKNEDIFLIGYESDYLNQFYGNLTKNILQDFFKSNKIKRYKFVEKKKSQYKDFDIFLDDKKNNKISFYEEKIFKNAVYFIAEEDKLVTFDYPESISKLKVGIRSDSFSDYYVKENFQIRDNFFLYNDINYLIDDFNNQKIEMIIIDRVDYYKNLLILPKKYLFFIEIGEEFGYIYFKNQDIKNLFNLFLKENNIIEKEWKKFVL